MSKVLHTFYGVNMSIAHRGMHQRMEEHKVDDLGLGEVAVFINNKMTAAKILHPGGHIHYWRSLDGAPLTTQMLLTLPARISNRRLNFGSGLPKLMKAIELGFAPVDKRKRA